MLRNLFYSDVLTWTICRNIFFFIAQEINQACQKIIVPVVLNPLYSTSTHFIEQLIPLNNSTQAFAAAFDIVTAAVPAL